jgi:hypothetical protein
MFVIFFSGHIDKRCLSIAMFVREVDDLSDSFNAGMCYPDCRQLLCCHLTSISKHLEHWRSAVDKVYSWTFLNKESEAMHPSPSYLP